MDKPELIPLADLERGNPAIWEQEESPQGVFLDTGDDALALLGAPAVRLPQPPRLPADFRASPAQQLKLEALARLLRAAACGHYGTGTVPLHDLDLPSREAMREILGAGEVSGEVTLDTVSYRLTESLLTGVWHIRGSDDSEWIEVGPVPLVVDQAARALAPAPLRLPAEAPGVMNGLAVLAEVNEHAARWDSTRSNENRVLNFTLLPMSPEDQQLIIDVLGRADLVLESGGFGQCRVMATTVRHVWAVQYVNALGNTILDTLEIGATPSAARAAPEDFEDSAKRYEQIMEAYLS